MLMTENSGVVLTVRRELSLVRGHRLRKLGKNEAISDQRGEQEV